MASAPLRAQVEADLFAPFDAQPMSITEKRLIQTALAALGHYQGETDGVWGARSAAALARYAAAEFDSDPLNLHAASLYLAFREEVALNGWMQRFLPELGLSMAFPTKLLGLPEEEVDLLRWRGTAGLKVTATRQGTADAVLWHSAGVLGNARPDELTSVRQLDRLLTAGVFVDGQRFYARSDRIVPDTMARGPNAAGWSTILIIAPATQANVLNLLSASIAVGPPPEWALSEGRLSALVAQALALIGAAEPSVADLPDTASIAPPAVDGLRSGTGFYVGPKILVTAQHVVENCIAVTLVDGTPLEILARDEALDLAVLRTPNTADSWLAPDLGAAPRLGQRVFALGFPYFSLTGTALNVTGGNISALAGFQDDRRFVTISAPVQPGNSGGPLLDAHGGVLGVIVSRLNENYVAAETGTLPQNINYAVSNAELIEFLRRSGGVPAGAGLGGFSLDEGAPAGLERAVVPLVCE